MEFFFNHDKYAVVIEVEQDKCLAYFFTNKKITGDVWLFNIGTTPDTPPWEQEGEPPYQNSSEYCYPHNIILPILESEFHVSFGEVHKTAAIYFRGKIVGIVADGWAPGQSSFARKDSGVAKTMDREVPRPT